jgi:hypothetical protein
MSKAVGWIGVMLVIAGGLVLAGGYLGKYPNAIAAIGCGSGSGGAQCPASGGESDSVVVVGAILGVGGVAIIVGSGFSSNANSASSRQRR